MQAAALQAELVRGGVNACCVVAMRYWHPFTTEAVAQLQHAAVDQVVLLPLYPQYSTTTTQSSLNEWQRRWDGSAPTGNVAPFYRHPGYLDAVVDRVNEALGKFQNPESVRWCSAHMACRSRQLIREIPISGRLKKRWIW